MTQEKQREQAIQSLANILRTMPFSVEFKVVKRPNGIKIIHEVTKEEMDAIVEKAAKAAKKEPRNK
jgi:intracellular sulfur oxidation DsrE/DsrF family protein